MNLTEKGTWKPAAYRAPMLSNRRYEMGNPLALAVPILIRWGLPFLLVSGGMLLTTGAAKQAFPNVPFNQENIGISSLLGGIGVASYMFADVLPEEYKGIGYAIGVLGVGSSLYLLFQKPEKKSSYTKEPDPDNIVPSYYSSVPPLNIYVDPEQRNVGGLRRWLNPLSSGGEDFEVQVKNLSRNELTFYVGLEAFIEGPNGIQRIHRSPEKDPYYGRKEETLAPMEERNIVLSLPFIDKIQQAKDFAVDFEFFRRPGDQQAFHTTGALPMTSTVLPWG